MINQTWNPNQYTAIAGKNGSGEYTEASVDTGGRLSSIGYHWNTSLLAVEANTGGTTTGSDVNVTNFPASYPVTNANIDVALSTRLKPADTLTKVTTVDTITNPIGVKLVDESGVVYGIKQVDYKPRVSTMPYLYDIAEGNVTGHTSFAKLGHNGDVGTSEEDIWGIGGVYVYPTSAQQMEVVSTSVEDDILTAGSVAGTGVHKVKIGYLDNTYAAQTEEVTLNGTVAVLTVATNILRVNSIRVSVAGTGNKAAGLITIRNKTDHTTVYRSIAVGLTRGREMVYTVPLGKTLYITSIVVSSGYSTVGKNVRWTARANLDDVNMTILPVGLMMPYFEVQTQDSAFYREFEIPLKVPATCDLKLSAISDSNNSVCAAAIRGWTE
jgi:hypothetical protein